MLKEKKRGFVTKPLRISARLVTILVIALVFGRSYAADNVPLLVEVPVPPQQITRLDERCNYIVHNFWKNFNFKGAFSSIERMDATLGQFLSVTPYASADTVYMAIETLTKGVEKGNPKNLLTLAAMAERWCVGDSAEYPSEDLMLPFARAVADSKKLKGDEKKYYSLMAQRMANSRVGVAPADFTFTAPDGTLARLSEVTEPTVLIFFYDPNDFDSRLARTRLGNDFVVKTLTQHNLLRIVAIYPGAPDQAWYDDIDSMPDRWVIGAAPGIDDYFTLKRKPQLYFLDENRIITDKDFSVDAAIMYFGQFIQKK